MIFRSYKAPRFPHVLLILLSCCLLLVPAFAVNAADTPIFHWIIKVSDEGYDINKMRHTTDGSIIASTDRSLIKYDSKMKKTWELPISDSVEIKVNDFSLSKEGGCVVLYTDNQSQTPINYLMAVDQNGKQIWTKILSLGEKQSVQLTKIDQAAEGGFVLAGSSSSVNVLLCRVDPQGAIIWTNSIKKDKALNITGLESSSDGNLLLVGNYQTEWRKPDGPGAWIGGIDQDGFVWNMNAQGQLLWEKNLPSTSHTSVSFVQGTADGGCVIGGNLQPSSSTQFRVYYAKLSPDGSQKWQQELFSRAYTVNFMQPTKDNCLLVLAGSVIRKVDQDGNTLWEKNTGGSSQSILETTDGYLVAGLAVRPPGIYSLTAVKLSRETDHSFAADYTSLSQEAKAAYFINAYELENARLEQRLALINKYGISRQDRIKFSREYAGFEQMTQSLESELHTSDLARTLEEYLYGPNHSLLEKYIDLKRQYTILAETKGDKHLYLPDELQKRYGNRQQIAGANMDGLIVTKAGGSFYNLDLRNVQSYTISDNRLDLVVKGKTYFLYTDWYGTFPTYAGVGVHIGDTTYVFNTSKLKKPIANEMIQVNDVIKYMLDNPKKTSLKYKDLLITKSRGGVYNIKISRVYATKNKQRFLPGGGWQTGINSISITTKGPAVTYYIDTSGSTGNSSITEPTTLLKFKNRTYKITLTK